MLWTCSSSSVLPRRPRVVLQLVGHVEMVLDGLLAAPGDQDDVLDAGVDGFLHHVLDHRLVHQGQHFLGLGLGGREEPGAKAGDGDDGFPDVDA